jgi:hypothetical protein
MYLVFRHPGWREEALNHLDASVRLGGLIAGLLER